MIFLLDPSYSALINLRLIQLWQVSLPLLQSSVSTFFTLGTLIKQIHLWNYWLPLTGQPTRKILDRFAVFWCRLMQKKESKSKNYNASDNRAKTQKRGEKILTCNVLNMRLLRKGSCKWKHLCTYSLHKCLLCTGKSVRVLVKYIFIMSPVFQPSFSWVFLELGTGSFVVCTFKKHFFHICRSPWPSRCCGHLGTCVIWVLCTAESGALKCKSEKKICTVLMLFAF